MQIPGPPSRPLGVESRNENFLKTSQGEALLCLWEYKMEQPFSETIWLFLKK